MNTSECSVERGSGNVFADLNLPDAESHLLKAELVGPYGRHHPAAPHHLGGDCSRARFVPT